MKAFKTLLLPLLFLLFLAPSMTGETGVAAPAALPAPLQATQNRAALVVSTGDSVLQRCVAFAEEQITGYDLLLRSGLNVEVDTTGQGVLVCRIGTTGCPADDCFCACSGGGDCVYWSYWHRGAEGWAYSQQGASTYQVTDGAVDGWVWGPGSVNQASPPPDLTFDDVCGTASATDTPVPTWTRTPSLVGTRPPTATPTRPPTLAPPATATPTSSPAAARSSPTASPMPGQPTATPHGGAPIPPSPTSRPLGPTPTRFAFPTPTQIGTLAENGAAPATAQPAGDDETTPTRFLFPTATPAAVAQGPAAPGQQRATSTPIVVEIVADGDAAIPTAGAVMGEGAASPSDGDNLSVRQLLGYAAFAVLALLLLAGLVIARRL